MCSSFSTPVHTIIHIQVHCYPPLEQQHQLCGQIFSLSLALLLVITLQPLCLQPCYWLIHCSLSFFSLAVGYYAAAPLSLALLLVIMLQPLSLALLLVITLQPLSLALLLVITLQPLFLQPCCWLLHSSLTFKDFWSHPGSTALVVCHVSLYIAGRAKVADLQYCSTLDQQ